MHQRYPICWLEKCWYVFFISAQDRPAWVDICGRLNGLVDQKYLDKYWKFQAQSRREYTDIRHANVPSSSLAPDQSGRYLIMDRNKESPV